MSFYVICTEQMTEMTIYMPGACSVFCVSDGDTCSATRTNRGTNCATNLCSYVDYSLVYRSYCFLYIPVLGECDGSRCVSGDFRQVWDEAKIQEMNIVDPLVELDRIVALVNSSDNNGTNIKQCFSLLQSYLNSPYVSSTPIGSLTPHSSDCVVDVDYFVEMLFCTNDRFMLHEHIHSLVQYVYVGVESEPFYTERRALHRRSFNSLFHVLRKLRLLVFAIHHLKTKAGALPHVTRNLVNYFVRKFGAMREYFLIEFDVPGIRSETLRLSDVSFDDWREVWPGTATLNMLRMLFESEFIGMYSPHDIMPFSWHGDDVTDGTEYMYYGFENVRQYHHCNIVPGFRLFGKGYSGDVTGDGPSGKASTTKPKKQGSGQRSTNNNNNNRQGNNNNSNSNTGKSNVKPMSARSPANTSENKCLGEGKPSHNLASEQKTRTKYIKCDIVPSLKGEIRGAIGRCSFGHVAHYHPGAPKHNSGASQGNANAERRLVNKIMSDQNICFVRCEDVSEACQALHWHQLPSVATRSSSDQLDGGVDVMVEREVDNTPDQDLPVNTVGLDVDVNTDDAVEHADVDAGAGAPDLPNRTMDLVLYRGPVDAPGDDVEGFAIVPVSDSSIADDGYNSDFSWGWSDDEPANADPDDDNGGHAPTQAPTPPIHIDFTQASRGHCGDLPVGFLKIHQDLGTEGVLRLCTILYTVDVQRSYVEYFKDLFGMATCGVVENVGTLGSANSVVIGRETSFRWFWDVDLGDLTHVGERTRDGTVSSSMNYNLAKQAGFVSSGEDYVYINIIDKVVKECATKTLVTGDGSTTSGALVTIRKVIQTHYPDLASAAHSTYMLNTIMVIMNQLVLNHTKFSLCATRGSRTTETHGLNY